MSVRELDSRPEILVSYARAAGALLPGAGRLPFIPGGSKEVPQLELQLRALQPDPSELERYCDVCGFATEREFLPVTFPHVLAFPLHMSLMTDGQFPFGAIGLVHIENRITQLRPIAVGEPLSIEVRATPLAPHKRGKVFDVVTVVSIEGERVWEEASTFLRRGGGGAAAPDEKDRFDPPAGQIEWELPGDLGRRYGGVSGDRNPIHMNKYAAKLFGFPTTIAHGMWSKARCLAELEPGLPDALTVSARFRKPVLLPAAVSFGSHRDGPAIDFALRSARKSDVIHLEGRVDPATRTEK